MLLNATPAIAKQISVITTASASVLMKKCIRPRRALKPKMKPSIGQSLLGRCWRLIAFGAVNGPPGRSIHGFPSSCEILKIRAIGERGRAGAFETRTRPRRNCHRRFERFAASRRPINLKPAR
jgi:hypothetical protein